jgi:hypothetical protein
MKLKFVFLKGSQVNSLRFTGQKLALHSVGKMTKRRRKTSENVGKTSEKRRKNVGKTSEKRRIMSKNRTISKNVLLELPDYEFTLFVHFTFSR